MRALILKEFRQLLPICWLWLAVVAMGFASRFISTRVDEESFSGWYDGYLAVGSDPMIAAVAALVGLVTAWSLFPREVDDSTIDFLRALPVSRTQVFIGKYLAAVLLLTVLTIFSYSMDALVLAWNPESIGGRFYPQVFFTLMWRDILFSAIVIAHGVLISWFRITGLVIYVIYLLAIAWLESSAGGAGLFSVLSMLSNEYHGSHLIVDTRAILVHACVAILLLVIAHSLWARTPSARSGGKQRSRAGGFLRAVMFLVAFIGLGGALLTVTATENGSLVDDSLAVATTNHYRFAFHPADERAVDYVLTYADEDFRTLGDLLGTDELPMVRVNLAAASEHAAGLATWKTIRMDLDTFEQDVSQRRVLSHESVHVLQSVLSNRALMRHFGATRFFVEGMAQYLSFAIVPEEERRASNRAIAAVAWQRQDIRFEDMMSPEFASRHDPDLYYSLGDLWTESFVAVCGEPALGDFLRAAGREDVPRSLSGSVFWHDTLRYIGCELEEVNERFRRDMQALYDATDRSRFPLFESARVTRLDDGRVRIVATLTAEQGEDGESRPLDPADLPARFTVRVGGNASFVAAVDPVFRGRVDAQDEQVDELRVIYELPARAVPRSRFEYQLGYSPYADSRVWYDTRRTGTAAEASSNAASVQ